MADNAKTQLLALLNSTYSPTNAFDEGNLEFSVPVADTSQPGFNTKLTLTGVSLEGYKGTKDVFYNRVDLAALTGMSMVVSDNTEVTILAALNTQHATFLFTEDITEFSVHDWDPGTESDTVFDQILTANSTSFGWIGTVSISLMIPGTPPG